MSHFVVGVIVENIDDVDYVMEPFREFDGDDAGLEGILEFEDKTEEVKSEYENYLNELTQPLIDGEYMSFQEFANEEGYVLSVNEIDASTRWGYLYNPHGIWDWYVIGGRWSGELKTKDGSMVNYAKIKDVDFSPNLEVYNIEKRFWELIVEGASLNEGEDKPWSMWKPEYYIEKYGDAETYANHMANFSTFSLIDVEGNYFEQGSMGWFGVSDSDVESLATYKNDFERVFAQANPEHYLVLVDCHI